MDMIKVSATSKMTASQLLAYLNLPMLQSKTR